MKNLILYERWENPNKLFHRSNPGGPGASRADASDRTFKHGGGSTSRLNKRKDIRTSNNGYIIGKHRVTFKPEKFDELVKDIHHNVGTRFDDEMYQIEGRTKDQVTAILDFSELGRMYQGRRQEVVERYGEIIEPVEDWPVNEWENPNKLFHTSNPSGRGLDSIGPRSPGDRRQMSASYDGGENLQGWHTVSFEPEKFDELYASMERCCSRMFRNIKRGPKVTADLDFSNLGYVFGDKFKVEKISEYGEIVGPA